MSKDNYISLKQIRNKLLELGLRAGQIVMLHASLRAIGRVDKGPVGLLQTILDVLTTEGTLMMLVGTKGAIYDIGDMSEAEKKSAVAERIAFDPRFTPANPEWGLICEALRTFKGAHRSLHPDYSFAAIGRLAKKLTAGHSYDYCHGPLSPLGKLCDFSGKVLLLGAPFQSVTLVHLCEHLALVAGKRIIKYQAPIMKDGQRVLIDIERFDTRREIPGYSREDYFGPLLEDYFKLGSAACLQLGKSTWHFFDAQEFKKFGVSWLESNL